MKLPIKKKYFDAIKEGIKNFEWRDAHITFVCEETGRTITKYIQAVEIIPYECLPESLKLANEEENLFEDFEILEFRFK